MDAYVIGKKGRHRNGVLVDSLSRFFDVVEEDGFVPKESAEAFRSKDHRVIQLANKGRDLTSGELACSLAHIRAWQHLLGSDKGALAVFEDDAYLVNDNALLEVLNKCPQAGPWQLNLELRSADKMLWYMALRKNLVRNKVPPRGTAGYIISRRAAELCLEDFEQGSSKIDGAADGLPGPAGLVQYYVTLEPPIAHVNGQAAESLIGFRGKPEPMNLLALLSVLFDGKVPPHKKRGLIRLSIIKPVRYVFSVHFWTAWNSNR